MLAELVYSAADKEMQKCWVAKTGLLPYYRSDECQIWLDDRREVRELEWRIILPSPSTSPLRNFTVNVVLVKGEAFVTYLDGSQRTTKICTLWMFDLFLSFLGIILEIDM